MSPGERIAELEKANADLFRLLAVTVWAAGGTVEILPSHLAHAVELSFRKEPNPRTDGETLRSIMPWPVNQ